jgi:thiol-disulfide isomerase/thioredoxin
MKMILGWSLLLAAALNACGNAPTDADAAAAADSTKAVVSPNYLNGIDATNAGDKVGPVHLHGRIPGGAGNSLILYETEARNKSEIKRLNLTGETFDFGTLEVGRGVYILALNEVANSTEIILNPDEADVNLVFTSNRLGSTKSAPNSKENTGFFAYSNIERANGNEIRSLRQGAASAPERKAQVEQQVKAKEQELVAKQHEFIKQYPGTYLAKLLTLKNPKYPDAKGRIFEDLDPMDNSLVRSSAISDRIQRMMVTFSGGTDPGFLACIDLVKAHFEPNSVTLESALYSMLDGFYNTGKETICQYILDNYIFDEDCGADLSDAIRIRAQGIINLQVGKTPPNFTMDTSDGGVLDLMETAKKNKYTLVMFWASWCHKCEQEIPYVGPMYAKYNFKGLEVISVSLDNSRDTWKQAIATNGMTWPQVSQLAAWNSPVVTDYKITATPTYFLLDNTGKIVLKPQRVFQVEEFLKGKL